MKQRQRKPPVPRPAGETVRRAIRELILDRPLSARDIAVQLHIREREVYSHLEHIRLSLHAEGGTLEVTPAECRSCGFLFCKRDRLTPPGRCPFCRHEGILEPLFAIRQWRGRDGQNCRMLDAGLSSVYEKGAIATTIPEVLPCRSTNSTAPTAIPFSTSCHAG